MNKVTASEYRHGVAFAVRPQRKGSGRLEKIALVIPAEIVSDLSA